MFHNVPFTLLNITATGNTITHTNTQVFAHFYLPIIEYHQT